MAPMSCLRAMNNIIAWIVVLVVWYVAVFPFTVGLFGQSDPMMFWVANIAALLVLKSAIKEKIEELLRYS